MLDFFFYILHFNIFMLWEKTMHKINNLNYCKNVSKNVSKCKLLEKCK